MGILKRAMIEDQGDPYLAVQFFKVSARFRSASITRYYTRVIVICKASDRQPSPSAKRKPTCRVPWATGVKARNFTHLSKRAYEDNYADSCYPYDKWPRE